MTTELHRQRLDAVLGAVRLSGARTVLDLGCGEGPLLMRLARAPNIERVVGIDLSSAALHALRRKLRQISAGTAGKVELIQDSITEPIETLASFDVAVLLETIEHIDPDRLSLVERTVLHGLSPATVVITTPNADFNTLLGVPNHRFRHPDHRFEWGRAKFRSWADGVAQRNDYSVGFTDIAGAHPLYGGATQMAIFQSLTVFGRAGPWPGLVRDD